MKVTEKTERLHLATTMKVIEKTESVLLANITSIIRRKEKLLSKVTMTTIKID